MHAAVFVWSAMRTRARGSLPDLLCVRNAGCTHARPHGNATRGHVGGYLKTARWGWGHGGVASVGVGTDLSGTPNAMLRYPNVVYRTSYSLNARHGNHHPATLQRVCSQLCSGALPVGFVERTAGTLPCTLSCTPSCWSTVRRFIARNYNRAMRASLRTRLAHSFVFTIACAPNKAVVWRSKLGGVENMPNGVIRACGERVCVIGGRGHSHCGMCEREPGRCSPAFRVDEQALVSVDGGVWCVLGCQ